MKNQRELFQYVYIEEGERLEDAMDRAYRLQTSLQETIIVKCAMCEAPVFHQYEGTKKCECYDKTLHF